MFDSARAVTGFSPSPYAVTRDLYSMFSQNAKAYTYLTETLLPERLAIAQRGKDMAAMSRIGSVIESLHDFGAMSATVDIGKRQVMVPLPAFRETLVNIAKKGMTSSGSSSISPSQNQNTGR